MNPKSICLIMVAVLMQIAPVLVRAQAPGETSSTVRFKVSPFDLSDVSLLPGPFLDAEKQDITYLMQLEPDRLLSGFLETAGLTPKALKYGGWESRGVAGQALGHYMTALAYCYRSTHDQRCHDRLAYIVSELARCQAANKNGYSAAIPGGKKTFKLLKEGKISASQGDLNGSWAPWYVIHKEMSGLRDAWQLAGIDSARPVLIGLADWVYRTTDGLTEDQLETMMQCEFGGMNEVLLDVYAATGNPKYKIAADRFYHNAVLDPLKKHEDHLDGLHANTQIPKIIGEARRYEITGDDSDRSISEFFWNTVVEHHTYAMGGNSEYEHFGAPDKLSDHIGPTTAETCNTYNMLKLTLHLFEWNPQARYFDFYERALFNDIHASQDPGKPGAFTYYMNLKSGLFRTFSTPFDTFWCCVDTGMENHLRYTQGIYFHDRDILYINLFLPSRVRWQDKQMQIEQKTLFPYSDKISFDIHTSRPISAAFKFRKPAWAIKGMSATVNGTTVPLADTHDGYMEVAREWCSGDHVELKVPMDLRIEPLPDNPNVIAIMYGPIELAASLGRNGITPPAPYSTDPFSYMKTATPAAPEIVAGDRKVSEWIKPVDPGRLQFRTAGVGRPSDFELVPFFSLYHDRYAAYFHNYSPEGWKQHEINITKREKIISNLKARTVDSVSPGNTESEKAHAFESKKSRTAPFKDYQWRDALSGGSFSYILKLDPATTNALECTYWGSDFGNREFQVLADNQVLATVKLDGSHPQNFISQRYIIPAETSARGQARVTFKGLPGNMAGGVFDIRTVKSGKPIAGSKVFQNVLFTSDNR